MEEQVINLSDILIAVKRRWKMIVGITLGATIISAVISFFLITPKYEASTKLFIGKQQGENENYNYSDVNMYQNLLGTYSQAIQTKDLVQKAIDDSGYNYKVENVIANMTVATVSGTQIMQVKYKDNDPAIAQKLLDQITDEFIDLSGELVPNGNVKIIETAKLPTSPVSPNKKMNIAIAFLLGLMVSLGLVFLLEYLDNTYKNKEQLEKELDIPVLGLIPDVDIL